jgi:cyclase
MALKKFQYVAAAILLCCLPAFGQDDFSKVEIKVTQLTDQIWSLEGAGGTMAVSAGDDGIFLIDDQYAPLSDKILKAIAGIRKGPVRFILNTHWHGDHVGGNENIGKTGSLIVAHDNVRKRMSSNQFMDFLQKDVPPSASGALPVVTFSDTVTFHINGDTLTAMHQPAAHTDGDAIVHFKKANVIHMGDLFFSGMYPFIDLSSGGSVTGVIAGIQAGLDLAGEETMIIAGHGPAGKKVDLQGYLAMIRTVHDRVLALKKGGKSVDEAVTAKPTADLDELWGGGWIKGDQFVEFVYRSLKN